MARNAQSRLLKQGAIFDTQDSVKGHIFLRPLNKTISNAEFISLYCRLKVYSCKR